MADNSSDGEEGNIEDKSLTVGQVGMSARSTLSAPLLLARFLLIVLVFSPMIMASEYAAEVKCIICNDGSQHADGSLSKLTTKGASTVMKAADVRGRQDIIECLSSSDSTSHHVHVDCRKSFTDTRKLKRVKVDENQSSTSRTLRSDNVFLHWKTACFLCCQPANPSDSNVHSASTLVIRKTLMKCGMKRTDS